MEQLIVSSDGKTVVIVENRRVKKIFTSYIKSNKLTY